MADRLSNNSVTPSLIHVIDSTCDRFERAWLSGEVPRIEQYLESSGYARDTTLFRQLLLLDIDYRAKVGEQATEEEYDKRFPEHAAVIASVFQHAKGGCPSQATADWTKGSTGSEERQSTPRTLAGIQGAFGRFEVFEPIGQGAFGTVYRALDTRLGREVALKVPRAGILREQEDVDRFMREARSAALLRHPNIVPIYDAGEIDGVYYIVSGLVSGRTLREAIKQGCYSSVRDAAHLIAILAGALHYAHNKGIIHRDIKPENVMIDEAGEPHIMDFGLARREGGDVVQTVEGAQMGTPAYMSPEQAKGDSHLADARSDLWSLGVMLYELLTGQRPFQGDGSQILVEILQKDPIRPRRIDRSIPRDLETSCLKCLEKFPGRRYQAVCEFADDLSRFLSNQPIRARSISLPEYAWRWIKRYPARASFLVVALLCLLLFACVVLQHESFQQQTGELAEQVGQITSEKHVESNRRLAKQLALRAELLDKQAPENLQIAAQLAARSLELDESSDSYEIVQGALNLLPRPIAKLDLGDFPRFIIFSPNDRYLAACGEIGARVWDLETGRRVLDLRTAVSAVSVGHNGGIVAIVGVDGTRAWETATGNEILDLQFDPQLRIAVFAENALWLATADDRGTISVVDLSAGTRVTSSRRCSNVIGLAFTESCKEVLVATKDEVDKWNCAEDGFTVLARPPEAIDLVSVSRDGRYIAASTEASVTVTDVRTQRIIRQVTHPLEFDTVLSALAVNATANVLATSNSSKTRIWRLDDTSDPYVVENGSQQLDISGDGQYVALADNGRVTVWDRQAQSLLAHNSLLNASEADLIERDKTRTGVKFRRVTQLQFRASQLAGVGARGAWLWDWANTKTSSVMHGGQAIGLTPDGSGYAVAVGDSYGTELAALKDRLAQEGAAAVTRFLEHDGRVDVYDLTTENEVTRSRRVREIKHDIQFHSGVQPVSETTGYDFLKGVNRIAFTADQRHIATRTGTKTEVWNLETGSRVEDPTGLLSQGLLEVPPPKYLTDNSRVTTSGGIAQVWDTTTEEETARMIHGEQISMASFDHRGERLVTASVDGTIWVWEATAEAHIAEMQHESGIRQIAFSPDDSLISTVTSGQIVNGTMTEQKAARTAQRWTLTGEQSGPIIPFNDQRGQTVLSHDGRLIATAESDGTVLVKELKTGKQIAEIKRSGKNVRRVDIDRLMFAPSGNVLVVASGGDWKDLGQTGDYVVQVWNIFHEREANRIDFGSGPINAIRSSTPTPVAIDHTGSRLLMIGPNGGIWDLDSNQQVIRIPQSTRDTGTRYLDAGAVSLDGRYFATVVDDRIIVVSIESGNEVVSLERRHAIFLSFLPDAQRIAFVSGIHRLGERPQLEVWDHRSGESNIMAGLDFDIGTMSVSGDSKLLAIAGTNESINGQYVRIWNLNTREQVAVLRHPQAVTAISFGNTSKYIATGCQDCKVRIWTTAAADVANALKRRITKRLARQDWAKYGVSPYEIPTN